MPSKQLELPAPRTWGGRRAGAGRKPRPDAPAAHRARPAHDPRHPLHITLKFLSTLPSLRRRDLFVPLRAALARAARARPDFAIIHYSFQTDHLHLLVEAASRDAITTGMRDLTRELRLALNRALRRPASDGIFADRFHERALSHPTDTRNVLVYILLNWRKHFGKTGIDPCSSGPWFDGWRTTDPITYAPSPVAAPTTWLLRRGWRLRGLLDPHRDAPAASSPRRNRRWSRYRTRIGSPTVAARPSAPAASHP